MFFAKRLFVLCVAVSFLSACVATSQQTIDKLKDRPGQEPLRIVVIDPDVQLLELTAGGVEIPQADWTEAAQKHIKEHLRTQFSERDVQVVYAEEVAPDDLRSDQEIQVVKLHEAVGRTILLHNNVPGWQIPTKAETFEWSLGPDVEALKEKYGADYALFLFIKDSYASAGRVAVIAIAAILGASVQGGVQIGFASLVDLDTGEVVWFNQLARTTGDLRESDKAAETVDELLTNFPS